MFSLPELRLDLSPPSIKSSFPDILTELSITNFGDFDDLFKLNEFIFGLEDELNKILAFQRELPISFTLLNDAIKKLKEKANKCKERYDVVEKKDWMSSAQLWCPRNEEEEYRRKAGGPGSVDRTEKPRSRPVGHAVERKQRRCWSPELHRRFVDALEMLGGSQVATPKQIRDLMKVDGLTNDEVKSHLQKYRLHIRKVAASSTKTLSSVDQGMSRDNSDELELGYSEKDKQHPRSPESPLHFVEPKKSNSSSMEEDDEEKSDGHS